MYNRYNADMQYMSQRSPADKKQHWTSMRPSVPHTLSRGMEKKGKKYVSDVSEGIRRIEVQGHCSDTE